MKNIHVLPTSQPSRLYKNKVTGKLEMLSMYYFCIEDTGNNIYITSDEEIKEGDWFIHSSHGITNVYKAKSVVSESIITECDNGCWIQYCKKIILTTDQDLIKDGVQAIDDEFLDFFVKNPSCEEIEVERMFNVVQFTSREFIYKIIIPKIEPKQETLEEAVQKVANSDDFINGALFAYQLIKEKNEEILMENWREGVRFGSEFEKAKEQDKNMFSEEEVKKLIKDFLLERGIGREVQNVNEWFEQNKNK